MTTDDRAGRASEPGIGPIRELVAALLDATAGEIDPARVRDLAKELANAVASDTSGGALPPIEVHLDVAFVRSSEHRPSSGPIAEIDRVPAALRERLIASEGRVLSWLAEREERRIAFATDPLAVLRQDDAPIDKRLVAELEQWITRPGAPSPEVRVRLTGASVTHPRRQGS